MGRDRDRGLVWVLGWLLALVVGWNAIAASYGSTGRKLRVHGAVCDRAARDLAHTLAELPAPTRPRVVLYGSSQVATVKRDGDDSTASMPHRLADALDARGVPAEVADFSDGGQQLIESMVVHYATRDAVHASAIVVGVSLFAMTQLGVRPTLFEGIDGRAVLSSIRAQLPPGADEIAVRRLLAWGDDLPAAAPAREPTIQERLDAAIGGWLDRHVAAYANRQTMYRDLLDRPARLAMERRARARSKRQIATTYAIGPAYPPSLLALEMLRRSAADRGIPFVVVLLPFDDDRPPNPFEPETQARVAADVRAIAARSGSPVVDLSQLLPSAHFGDYEDGSPDNLHFDAAGHAAVAERVAEAVAPLLRERR